MSKEIPLPEWYNTKHVISFSAVMQLQYWNSIIKGWFNPAFQTLKKSLLISIVEWGEGYEGKGRKSEFIFFRNFGERRTFEFTQQTKCFETLPSRTPACNEPLILIYNQICQFV